MNEQLKKDIEHGLEKMRQLKDTLVLRAQDLEDKGQAFWQDAERHLKTIEAKLITAQAALKQNTDEAILQAHLAAMEANDRWQHMKDSIEKAAQESSSNVKTGLDYALLKAHLAKMDSVQFLQEDGKAMLEKLKKSQAKTSNAIEQGLATMSKHMDQIANHLRRDV